MHFTLKVDIIAFLDILRIQIGAQVQLQGGNDCKESG